MQCTEGLDVHEAHSLLHVLMMEDIMKFGTIQFRSTKLYQKNLGDPDDVGVETEDTNRRAYDIETFGGFVYYHVKNRFDNDAILIVESNNFVSGNLGSFKDFVFLHHSLQPGK